METYTLVAILAIFIAAGLAIFFMYPQVKQEIEIETDIEEEHEDTEEDFGFTQLDIPDDFQPKFDSPN